jgi:hypothetical protein
LRAASFASATARSDSFLPLPRRFESFQINATLPDPADDNLMAEPDKLARLGAIKTTEW